MSKDVLAIGHPQMPQLNPQLSLGDGIQIVVNDVDHLGQQLHKQGTLNCLINEHCLINVYFIKNQPCPLLLGLPDYLIFEIIPPFPFFAPTCLLRSQ